MHWVNFIALVIGLILSYMLGFWTKRQLVQKGNSEKTSFGMVESSLLALFAFFLGFTFSISASKIETVRVASVQESNAIGTALLRTQLYGAETASEFKSLFKNYLQARTRYFHEDPEQVSQATKNTKRYGQNIWDFASDIHLTGNHVEASRLMLPAINDMLDAVSTRDSAIRATLPPSIIYTLYALSFLSCFIVGFSMKRKFWTNFIGMIYILIIALTVNLILDAGDPRRGFINTKKANQEIEELYNDLL